VRLALALVLAFALTWLLGYWIRQSEIVILACQVTEAVPPIPAVVVLLLLVLLNPLLRRIPWIRAFSSGEIALIYAFTTIATTMFGCAVVRFLISLLAAGHYYSSGEFPMEQIVSNIPAWLAPHSPLYYRTLYEGAPSGHVPWNVWWLPILAWSGFFTLLGGALIGAMMLMADRWIDHERLAFPLVQLPLEMMGKGHSGSFFKNRAMWIGFSAAALLNLYNASSAVWGGGHAGTMYFTIGKETFEYPWAAVVPFSIHLRPELIGLGYLVSTEVSFSIWFSWVLHQFEALFLSQMGLRVEGIPFVREQGIGVYFMLGMILLWKDRQVLVRAWQGWFGRGHKDSPHRWGLLALGLGAAGVLMFWTAAGLDAWLAVVYLISLLLTGIVYARARAETGVPLVWAFPFMKPQGVIFDFLGTAPITGFSPTLLSPTIFALFTFLSRGFFLGQGANSIEGLALGRKTGVKWPQMATALLLALAWGTAIAFIFHLQPYYGKGAIGLQEGGIWGDRESQSAYMSVINSVSSPQAPNVRNIGATIFGAGLAGVLSLVRWRFMGFPLNPIGYAVACSYGSLVWGPFLIVWLLKTVILHYGGGKSYLKSMPAFLGFALGHFITAGAIWGSLSATLGGIFRRWSIWFG
jgi:hypothetical protein